MITQYLGAKSPASVQKKVIEIMYSWQAGLPEEPKIIEAYQMLKKQGMSNPKSIRIQLHVLIDSVGLLFILVDFV